MKVAETIVYTIRKLDRMAFFAWGAKNLIGTKNGLRFKTSGCVKRKLWVHIELNAKDLYDVEFFRIWKGEKKLVASVEDIYFDSLIETIDRHVG